MTPAHRNQRIAMAVSTSLLSKGATMVLQIAVMPIAIRKLGLDLYAVYSILTSFLLLISLSEFGVGPRLIRTLSMAEVRGNRKEQQIAFSSAFLMVATIGIAATVLLSVGAQVVPATWIAGPAQQAYVSTIRQCVPVVSLLGLVQLLANVVQRAQAGFQELHFFNLAGGLGNVLMIFGIAVFLWIPTSVLSLTLCLYGSQSLALLGNMAGFLWRRPWLSPKLSLVCISKVRSYLNEGAQVSLNQSILPWLQRELTKILLFRLAGASVAAKFSICLQLAALLGGAVAMLTTPLYGAISDAVSKHELAWVVGSLRKLLIGSLAYCATLAVVFHSFGNILLPKWLGPQARFSQPELLAFVAYFSIAALKHIFYVFIVSIKYAGLVTVVSLAEAVVGVALIASYGHIGLLFTLLAWTVVSLPSALLIFPALFLNLTKDRISAHPVIC
jgi:O-antigen/teichoic acid export membrane protein